MKILPTIFACFLALSVASPLAAQDAEGAATDDFVQTFTCPVGGKTFRQRVDVGGYPLLSLPNGSTPGGEFSDNGVPECPDNGLVLPPKYDGEEGNPEAFAPYSAEEIAKLPTLIGSPDYRALGQEARYVRLYWLAGQLGRPAIQRFHLLQHVSWVGLTPDHHRRNLELFVKDADALVDGPEIDPDHRTLAKYYVVNALRELGRFDEAAARLTLVEADWHKRRAIRKAQEDPNFFEDGDDLSDELPEPMLQMRDAIATRNVDVFPVAMMSDRWANAVCNEMTGLETERTRRDCKSRKSEREAALKTAEKTLEAAAALGKKTPAKLGAMCAASATVDQDPVLSAACHTLRQKNMAAQAEMLLANTEALDPQCKGMKIPRYATPKNALAKACQQRAETLLEAQVETLTQTMRATPAEYDRQCHWEYANEVSEDPVESACAAVGEERRSVLNEAERARINKLSDAELRAECARLSADKDDDNFTLRWRCDEIDADKKKAGD